MAGLYRHITASRENGTLVLTIDLEQVKDYIVAEELRYELCHAAKRASCDQIVLDLRNMRFMTSLACHAFLGLRNGVRDRHPRIVLCNMAPFIRKVFEAKRLLTPSPTTGRVTFEAVDTLEEALELFVET
ncbi:MAG: anti-sigma factor antagonist [Planctomycetota bacterium]|nr:MAG: anti-sigma factor antagonist [Planctomycetota bacterium]